MQGSESEAIQKYSSVRVLDLGAVLIHYHHLQGGFKKARACGLCAKGLDGAYEEVAQSKPVDEKPAVPESDGVDQKGDPAHTSDYGDYTRPDAN